MLPTPRSSSSGERTISEMQTSSLNVVQPESKNSLGISMLETNEHDTSSGLDEFHWLMYLRRWFLALKHQADETDDDIALFLNGEADNVVNFIESIDSRSIARGFVTLGSFLRRARSHLLAIFRISMFHVLSMLKFAPASVHATSGSHP